MSSDYNRIQPFFKIILAATWLENYLYGVKQKQSKNYTNTFIYLVQGFQNQEWSKMNVSLKKYN